MVYCVCGICKEPRPIVWAEYAMGGKLYAHLLKVEDTAQDLLNNMMPGMEKEPKPPRN